MERNMAISMTVRYESLAPNGPDDVEREPVEIELHAESIEDAIEKLKQLDEFLETEPY
jgi:hypothetical protein